MYKQKIIIVLKKSDKKFHYKTLIMLSIFHHNKCIHPIRASSYLESLLAANISYNPAHLPPIVIINRVKFLLYDAHIFLIQPYYTIPTIVTVYHMCANFLSLITFVRSYKPPPPPHQGCYWTKHPIW